jgi:hypothetical protein
MSRIKKIWRKKSSEIFEWKNEAMVSGGGTVDDQTKLMAMRADVVRESTLPKIEEHRVKSGVSDVMTLLKYRSMVCDV